MFRELPGPGRRARRRERHAGRSGAHPDRAPRGEVLLLEQVDGEVWEALARPTRRLRAGDRHGAVELLEHLGEGRWRVRLDGEPDGRGAAAAVHHRAARRRRSATRRSMRASAARRRRRRPGCTSRPELLAQLDVERVTLHVGLDTFRPLQEERRRGAPHPRRALLGRAGGVGADPGGASACSRSGRPRCACSRRSPRGAPLAGRTELFITPGLRVPAGRPSPDELPPAALDPARARDGVRRRGGDAAPVRRSRSRSATASIPSAMRC